MSSIRFEIKWGNDKMNYIPIKIQYLVVGEMMDGDYGHRYTECRFLLAFGGGGGGGDEDEERNKIQDPPVLTF